MRIQLLSLLFIAPCLGCESTAVALPETPSRGDGTAILGKGEYDRKLWASVNGLSEAVGASNRVHNNKLLISWRFLPTDTNDTAFDLYRTTGTGKEVKLNDAPIFKNTCFQDVKADLSADNTYRLTYHGKDETLGTYTVKASWSSKGLPYISIPLKSTADINPGYVYRANDASIGDLDGDGEYELVVKRMIDSSTVGGLSSQGVVIYGLQHSMLLEAYRMDGTFMWRMKMGPNVPTGNGASFAVYDFNGDGRAEVALRTAEGTVFGDRTEIGDTDGDGKTNYQVEGAHYIHGGPEFLSVIEGTTGKELARTDYIALGSSEEWGDNYYKRSSSYRIGVAHCTGKRHQIIICRGVYKKSVLEAWDFSGNKLTKVWRFDSNVKGNEAYAGQGYHSLSTGDVDNDGYDEIVYGAMTVDHDGKGLYSYGYGHGDALHLGKFDIFHTGLQVYSSFEGGAMGAALRDARTGKPLWEHPQSGDIGRALVADIDPSSPGCEFWWAGSNAQGWDGTALRDLGYKPSSCNMAIWFSGSLNRQLLNNKTIQQEKVPTGTSGRVFSLSKYGVTDINGTKSNPCLYADLWGDWREEVIMPASDNSELRIFTTWYPTEYRFPYLMSDHVYHMSVLNQNIGYNQPTQLGYYLGSDMFDKAGTQAK